jgi:hypothetical protein
MPGSAYTPFFARQFAPDGDGFLYRCRLQGPAIRVTAEERAQFIDAFENVKGGWGTPSSNWFAIVAISWVVAFSLEIKFLPPAADGGSPLMIIALVMYAIEKIIAVRRAWNAPMKEVAGRPQVAPAIVGPVLRNAILAATTWRSLGIQLLVLALYQAFCVWVWFGRHIHEVGTFSWLAVSLLCGGKLLRDAVLKWQIETNRREPLLS